MSGLQTSFKIPGRTVHNLSHVVKFDARPGVIYPVTHIPMLPVDRIEAELRSLVLTFPTKSPLISNFKARIYAFWVPYSLYVPEIKANSRLKPSIGEVNTDTGSVGGVANTVLYADNWADVQLPQFTPADAIVGELQPHNLWDFLGVPVGFRPADYRNSQNEGDWNYQGTGWCGLRLLMYYDIFRNYFANPMEVNYPLYSGIGTFANPGTTWALGTLDDLNNYYENRSWLSAGTRELNRTLTPWYLAFNNNLCASYAGMLVKTFTRDMNNVFLADANYQQAIAHSIINVSSGQLDLTQLAVGQRLYEYFVKVAATGGRFDEFARAEWGVDLRGELDIPMFLRSWSFDIGFDTVVSNASTDTRELGALAGRGIGGMKKRDKRDRSTRLNFSSNQYGELVFYMTIEPYNDYYQGFDPFLVKTYLGDLHTPSLDRIGWQPMYLAQINALNSSARNSSGAGWESGSNPFSIPIGYQPAWTEYKSMVSRLHGDLAVSDNSLHNWVLSRNYEQDSFGGISGLDSYVSYIDPASYVSMFSDTSTSSDPFIVQIAFDVTAKRPVSNSNIHVF